MSGSCGTRSAKAEQTPESSSRSFRDQISSAFVSFLESEDAVISQGYDIRRAAS
jgi:hypothetical protein